MWSLNFSMQNYVVADTSAPLSFFAKDGYYIVGNKIYNHKVYALQEATRTGLPVKWHFNNEVYDKLNWTHNPGIPILDLYRLRAQQLRNRYDYIICCWSGGGDSTTMVEAFLENGIHLDEIVTLWPITLSQGKYTPNAQDRSNLNMPSEYDFSIKPRIDAWRKQYPNQLITVADTCNISRNEFQDDTVRIMEKHSYLTIQRWRQMDQILRDRMDRYGNNVCMVIGANPVEIDIVDNYLTTHFTDTLAANGLKSDYTASGIARKVESFYWTPDMPEIVLQQAHDVYNFNLSNPANKQYFSRMTMLPDRTYKSLYSPDEELFRRVRKKIVYPKFAWDWFQVGKQDRTHENPQWETWFNSNPHAEEFLQPWRSAIRSHTNLIADQWKIYHNGNLATYKKFYSKFYVVGRVPENEPNINLGS
jgi:hypothetical protein